MKVIERELTNNKEVEVGDIVFHQEEYCMLVYNVLPKDHQEKNLLLLISLMSGNVLDSYRGLDDVNRQLKLKCKNKDVKMILEEVYF